MIEQWTSTLDTREAAAFGTLGVPCKLRSTLIEKTSQRVTRFFLGLASLDNVYQTRPLRGRWRSGDLESREPAHPFLTILRGMENRMRLLDFQNKGIKCALARVPGTEIWQYVPSDQGLTGCHGRGDVIKTDDLKMVSALGIMGLPLLMLEGSGHQHQYYLPRHGPRRADGVPPVDGVKLLTAWRDDKASIPWEHPFAQAARGLYNRERFLDAVNRDVELVLLMKPRSSRSALVRIDANPTAFDQVKTHFDA